MNQAQITKEAKRILDNFAKFLEKIKIKPKSLPKKTGGFRGEKEPQPANEEFKKRILSNAPESDGDFIIAEKKTW
jgi:Asp-tRNA(Asn)/Glu-tRNA(Gln) amidotransferase C subunit